MKFFKKRWVAVTLCILMILAALSIGQVKSRVNVYDPSDQEMAEDWGEDNASSYTRYIYDEAGLLSSGTIGKLAEYNAAFDYTYGTIVGVGIAELTDGSDLEDHAFVLANEIGLGERDYFLLLDTDSQDWYFAYGEDAGVYADHRLEILVTGAMKEPFRNPDDTLLDLFDELEEWCADTLPVESERFDGGSMIRVAGGTILFVLLIIGLVLASVISAIGRAGRRFVHRSAFWGPTIHVRGPHFHAGPRPGPGPRPTSGPRPGGSSMGGRKTGSGGFGSGSRGGFSRGGGFGGSRGGFGGKR